MDVYADAVSRMFWLLGTVASVVCVTEPVALDLRERKEMLRKVSVATRLREKERWLCGGKEGGTTGESFK